MITLRYVDKIRLVWWYLVNCVIGSKCWKPVFKYCWNTVFFLYSQTKKHMFFHKFFKGKHGMRLVISKGCREFEQMRSRNWLCFDLLDAFRLSEHTHSAICLELFNTGDGCVRQAIPMNFVMKVLRSFKIYQVSLFQNAFQWHALS